MRAARALLPLDRASARSISNVSNLGEKIVQDDLFVDPYWSPGTGLEEQPRRQIVHVDVGTGCVPHGPGGRRRPVIIDISRPREGGHPIERFGSQAAELFRARGILLLDK